MDQRRHSPGSPLGGKFAPSPPKHAEVPQPSTLPLASPIEDFKDALESTSVDNVYASFLSSLRVLAYANKCLECGQYADDKHECPRTEGEKIIHLSCLPSDSGGKATLEPVELPDYPLGSGPSLLLEVNVPLPPATTLTSALPLGRVRLGMLSTVEYPAHSGLIHDETGTVSGTLDVYLDDGLRLDSTRLHCSCLHYLNTGACLHKDIVEQAVRQRIPDGGALDEEELTEHVLTSTHRASISALTSDWMHNEEYHREAEKYWREPLDGILYSTMPGEFIVDVKNELTKHSPQYSTNNVLDGYCQRGSGQAFGVEMEYEFPASMPEEERARRQAAIGSALYEAGLIPDTELKPYRSAQSRPFTDAPVDSVEGRGSWTWEADRSVNGGEVITNGLYDEKSSWVSLDKVLSILRDNGAEAGTHSGLHVHVGTGTWASSPQNYTELARFVTQHEDVIVRMGTDPARGVHRNNGYASPMPVVPAKGFTSLGDAIEWQKRAPGGRDSGLNLMNCSGTQKDHVEYRMFDATFSPGALQADIKLAVAATAAAERIASNGGTTRGKEPWGAHYTRVRNYGSPSTVPELLDDYGTTRSLLDTLYRRREDKSQAAGLLLHTRWSSPPVVKKR